MTFQIGAVLSDGIVLASDLKIIEIDKAGQNATTSGHSPKIIFSENPPVMYCWAGDETPGRIARAFVNNQLRSPSMRMHDLLYQAGMYVWTEDYGPKYKVCPTKVELKHWDGDLLLAARTESGIELWRVHYGADCEPRQISDKSSCGNNCAIFLLEKYYTRSLTIKEALPLIAHCIIMGGEINSTGVDGLEIATWIKDEDKPTRLSPTKIDSLIQTSRELDEGIGKLVLGSSE